MEIRHPDAADAAAVHALIARCPPLDTNSVYCNLLQCAHFSETSAIAHSGGHVVGFVSGYRFPGEDDAVFVWQVAVDRRARGLGLARRMIHHVLCGPASGGLQYLHTTVTPGNRASRAMFSKLAEDLETTLTVDDGFDRHHHLNGAPEDEQMLTIGPFNHKPSNQKSEVLLCRA